MPDHYTYPGAEVLVNTLGITDEAEWKAVETAAIGQRLIDLQNNPVPGRYDLAHLQAIHRRLTQDLYAWGGTLRDTDTGPGGTGLAHCRPQFIPAEADRIFAALADMNYLRERDADTFSQGLAWVWGETTVLHPFRDVNTRTQHVFFNQLATDAGWVIDWERVDPYVFAHARTVAIARDETGIDALLRPALIPAAEVARHDGLRTRMEQVQQEFFRPRARRTRETLDTQLHAAIEHRQQKLTGADPTERRGPTPPDRPSLGR